VTDMNASATRFLNGELANDQVSSVFNNSRDRVKFSSDRNGGGLSLTLPPGDSADLSSGSLDDAISSVEFLF
jgi:hypothetical protein